jgi:hypothetical protein
LGDAGDFIRPRPLQVYYTIAGVTAQLWINTQPLILKYYWLVQLSLKSLSGSAFFCDYKERSLLDGCTNE